jgi:hypothetical protein
MLVCLLGSLLGLYCLRAFLIPRSILATICRASVRHLATIGRALSFSGLAALAVDSSGIPGALGYLTAVAL